MAKNPVVQFLPSVETVEALVCPTLGLPPGVLLKFLEIGRKAFSEDGLLNHLDEQSTPGDQGCAVALALREIDLDSMVVALEDNLEHLGSLNIVGIDQSSTDLLNGREEGANDLVQWLAVGNLEPVECQVNSVSIKKNGSLWISVCLNGKDTLLVNASGLLQSQQTNKDNLGVLGLKQSLHLSKIAGVLGRKVVGQDHSEDSQKLSAVNVTMCDKSGVSDFFLIMAW